MCSIKIPSDIRVEMFVYVTLFTVFNCDGNGM